MQEAELRALIEDVRTEKLPRRSFIERLVGLGLTAPMASMLLMHAGVAQSQPAPVYKPTKRGGGGALKVLWWQGATLLQPHFAGGTKDQEGSRIFYEPLAVWDNDGNLVPILAADIPSVANGGVLEGGKVVTLAPEEGRHLARRQAVHRRRLSSSPGSSLAIRPRACVTIAVYKDLTVDEGRRLHGAVVSFKKPTPFWATAFVAAEGRDHPEAPVRPVRRRQVARRAHQPQAGRHRPVQVRRFQAGRHRPRRDQQELPHAEPALLRHHRDEGRRRRDLGGARRAADRRVRLRLEPAGRGRGAASAWKRAARARSTSCPAATSSSSSSTSPTRGTRSTASAAASRASTSRSATRRCARRCRCSATRRACRSSSTAAPASRPANFMNNPRALPLEEHQVGVQRRQGERHPRRRRLEAGRRRHPRKGRQEDEVRLPDVDQRHAPEGAGDRQAGGAEGRHRPRAEVGDAHRCSSRPTSPTPTRTRSSGPTCRCTRRP